MLLKPQNDSYILPIKKGIQMVIHVYIYKNKKVTAEGRRKRGDDFIVDNFILGEKIKYYSIFLFCFPVHAEGFCILQ